MLKTLLHDAAVLVVSLPVVRHRPIHPRLGADKGQVSQEAHGGSFGLIDMTSKDLLVRHGLFGDGGATHHTV